MSDHITLSPEIVSNLCPTCKSALIEALGLSYEQSDEGAEWIDDESEYADLGLQAARAFLLGCNAKTRQALQLVVQSGETFSIHDIEEQMGIERGGLRGVWSGLTKRTRTITGDPDASLVDWSEPTDSGDYIGRLLPTTRTAFEKALRA